MKCPTCGAENEDDSIFCTKCGTILVPAPSQPNESGIIYCPQCGAENPATAEVCRQCSADLGGVRTVPPVPAPELQFAASAAPAPEMEAATLPPSSAARKRPGCVSAYAIVLGISALLFAITGMALLLGRTPASSLLLLGSAVLFGVLAVGLWRLKNWARILLLIILGLELALVELGALLSLVGFGIGSGGLDALYSGIVQLVVSGIFIYWFAKHREYFD